MHLEYASKASAWGAADSLVTLQTRSSTPVARHKARWGRKRAVRAVGWALVTLGRRSPHGREGKRQLARETGYIYINIEIELDVDIVLESEV
jgi:hypothetical protein